MGYSVVQFWLYGYTTEYLQHRYASFIINTNAATIDTSSIDIVAHNNVKVSSIISFTSGATAGLCATIVTYPFDLCRTIFAARGLFPIAASNVTWSSFTTNLASASQEQYAQRRPPKSLQEFAKLMYQQKGVQGFFAGSAPALLQIVPYMGLNFALHDLFVGWRKTHSSGNDSMASGVAGMGAGVISKFLVYPLDTVKKRLQAQAFWVSNDSSARKSTDFSSAFLNNFKNRKKALKAVALGAGEKQATPVVYEGMFHCFNEIAQREGMAAFYKGLVA